MLRELIGFQNKEFTLIYRATRDGFAANKFHRRCDYQPRTLTIIKSSNGYIFGGFAMVEWIPNAGFITDPYAFVFTLVNPTNQPLKLPIVSGGIYAVYSIDSYGPSFGSNGGSGHCLHIVDNSDVNVGSYFHGGYSYECPLGKCDRAGEDFFNDNYRNWHTAEIETYLID